MTRINRTLDLCSDPTSTRSGQKPIVRAPFERGRREGLPGYEAQIAAGPPVLAGWATGAIGVTDSQHGWRMLQPSAAAVNPGEWFFLEVIVRGNRVGTWVNGVKVAELTDPEQRFQRGRIVLQSSGAGTRLEFRRIEMRPPAEENSDVGLPLSAAQPGNVP